MVGKVVEHNWILKVLEDIETYADTHQLHDIKASLIELRIIAASEIAAMARINAQLLALGNDAHCNVIALPNRTQKLQDTTAQSALFTTTIL